MPATLRREHDNLYRLEMSGTLVERDLRAVQRAASAEIARVGNIRLLVVLTQFDGWEKGANWRDLGFYARYGDHIERIAIIGEPQWRSEALMFAGADLRRAAVAYFRVGQAGRAEAWLTQ